MKFIFFYLYLFLPLLLMANTLNKTDYLAHEIPQNMSVSMKKERFFYLIAPAVKKIHTKLLNKFLQVEKSIKNKTDIKEINNLKYIYRVKTDSELLEALKPHPQSIVLAQAAIESAWATSRFFKEANNTFGMWSANAKEPRIAANIKREGVRTIWLRKFNSIEESIQAYYKLIAQGKAFKDFRHLRLKNSNPHELVKKLDKYSEIGAKYGEELSKIIRYNKLEKYDK